MDELLPCPHCGNADAPSVHTLRIGHRGGHSFGWCDTNYGGCGARGAVALTEDAAAAAWNRRAPAAPDPALLALAKLGARLCRDQLSPTGGFCHARYEHLDRIGIEEGVLMPGHLDSTGPVTKPGIAAAIAALLTPDGAGEAGEVADTLPVCHWAPQGTEPRVTSCGRRITFNLGAETCPSCGGRVIEDTGEADGD